MILEVLVATMNQIDFSIVRKMNLTTPAVIGNQTDKNEIIDMDISGNRYRMVSTNTRGVGLNRNLALSFSVGEVLLFADGDCVYPDDLNGVVNRAFTEYPDADVILFGIQFTRGGKIYSQRVPKKGKATLIRSLKYGTCSVAIKKEAVLKCNLRFTELFGGGCRYSHGEDSDFIFQCFRNKLNIYTYNQIICTTSKDESTCFSGYNKKYFFDNGALARHSFGVLAIPYMMYMSIRVKDTELSETEKFNALIMGYRAFNRLERFDEKIIEN